VLFVTVGGRISKKQRTSIIIDRRTMIPATMRNNIFSILCLLLGALGRRDAAEAADQHQRVFSSDFQVVVSGVLVGCAPWPCAAFVLTEIVYVVRCHYSLQND
jgi:hypothetical protein